MHPRDGGWDVHVTYTSRLMGFGRRKLPCCLQNLNTDIRSSPHTNRHNASFAAEIAHNVSSRKRIEILEK